MAKALHDAQALEAVNQLARVALAARFFWQREAGWQLRRREQRLLRTRRGLLRRRRLGVYVAHHSLIGQHLSGHGTALGRENGPQTSKDSSVVWQAEEVLRGLDEVTEPITGSANPACTGGTVAQQLRSVDCPELRRVRQVINRVGDRALSEGFRKFALGLLIPVVSLNDSPKHATHFDVVGAIGYFHQRVDSITPCSANPLTNLLRHHTLSVVQDFMCGGKPVCTPSEDSSDASDAGVIARRAVFIASLKGERQIVSNARVALYQPPGKRRAFWSKETVAFGAIQHLHGALKTTD